MCASIEPIYGFRSSELRPLLSFTRPYRVSQLFDWLYQKNIEDFNGLTNFSSSDRDLLATRFKAVTLSVETRTVSGKTETEKTLFRTHDGFAIEAVLIPEAPASEDRPDEPPRKARLTLCLSSQVGCSFACQFCATGRMGLRRNLLPSEIVEQYVILNRRSGYRIGNIVFMGMGEPFANADAVFRALGVLTDPDSFGLSPSRITVSTSGVFSGIERIMEEFPKVHLMVSLHSALQEVRDRIMPNLTGQKLPELRERIARHLQTSGREFTLEYVMLSGVNDREEDLRALVAFCRGLRIKVNLIAWNRVNGIDLEPSTAASIRSFKERLERQGIPAIQRYKKGDDIAAACGQLATQH